MSWRKTRKKGKNKPRFFGVKKASPRKIEKAQLLEMSLRLQETKEVEVVDFLEPTVRGNTIILPLVVMVDNKLEVVNAYIGSSWLNEGVPIASVLGRIMVTSKVSKVAELKGKKITIIKVDGGWRL